MPTADASLLTTPANVVDWPVADSFNPQADSPVLAMAEQFDGKLLVGGNFGNLGTVRSYAIARLHEDGALANPGLYPAALGRVNAWAVQLDGKIIFGGRFFTAGSQPLTNLARLNPDWTRDFTFNLNADGEIHCLAVQPDGKILVGGAMTNIGGLVRPQLARLNADGTVDADFNPGPNGTVRSVVVQPNGQILIGGSFTNVGNQPRERLARLQADGGVDETFNPGANYTVTAMMLQADGQILVGGAFTIIGGQNCNRLALLNSNGVVDLAFNPNPNQTVYSLAVQTDGKILACGAFTMMGTQSRTLIARLHPSGAVDEEFNPQAVFHPGPISWTSALALQQDGRILVGGPFTQLGGQIRTNIGRLYNTEPATESLSFDSTTITWLRGGTGPEVWRTSFAITANGVDWVELGPGTRIPGGWRISGLDLPAAVTIRARGFVTGGQGNGSAWHLETEAGFPRVAESPANQVVVAGQPATFSALVRGSAPLQYQWHSDDGPVPDATNALLTLSNVTTHMHGRAFWLTASNAHGAVTSAPAILSVLSLDSLNPGVNAIVRAMAIQPDGKLLVGGNFSSIAGQNRLRIARLNPDGTLDANFRPTASARVRCIAIQDDGKIIMGGDFSSVSGQSRSLLARLHSDGSLDADFHPIISGLQVYAVVVQADGKILVAGSFSSVNGQARNQLARLHSDGNLDADFNPTISGGLFSMAIQSNGKLLIGGSFRSVNGVNRNMVARLNDDGSLDTDFYLNSVFVSSGSLVTVITVRDDGMILLGGDFTISRSLGPASCNNFARLAADGTLDPDSYPSLWPGFVYSMALQVDQSIFVGGRCTNADGQARRGLVKLNHAGMVDDQFKINVNFPPIHALTLEPNGRLLVSGDFSLLGGEARLRFGRINSLEPATQSLALSGTNLIWLRGGSSPEVLRTRFAFTTNGADFINLGAGARIGGGWQLAGVDLPAHATVRARGYLSSGEYNGSSWFVETGLGPPVLAQAPSNQTVFIGCDARLEAYAIGSRPLYFQWHSTNGPMLGETNAALILNHLNTNDTGAAYWVVVSNDFGAVISLTATVIVPLDGDDDGLPDDWEQEHGLVVGENDGDADPDDDGLTNRQEYLAGTHPTQRDSVLKLEAPPVVGGGLTLRFEAVANRPYLIEYRDTLEPTNWLTLENVPAAPSNRTILLPQGMDGGRQRYFRVGTPGPP